MGLSVDLVQSFSNPVGNPEEVLLSPKGFREARHFGGFKLSTDIFASATHTTSSHATNPRMRPIWPRRGWTRFQSIGKLRRPLLHPPPLDSSPCSVGQIGGRCSARNDGGSGVLVAAVSGNAGKISGFYRPRLYFPRWVFAPKTPLEYGTCYCGWPVICKKKYTTCPGSWGIILVTLFRVFLLHCAFSDRF